ncbi:MAG TPA: hypothetical protein VL990_08005 [Acidobacteriaceae bacterium]|nr:hypothetical protein [Acidobacteriaceae bacterium]
MGYKVAWIGAVALGVETDGGRQLAFSLEEDQQIPSEFKEGDPIEIVNHPDHPSVATMGLESGGFYEITHLPTGKTFRTWHRADMYKVEGR